MRPDSDAYYNKTLSIDLDTVEPHVSGAYDVSSAFIPPSVYAWNEKRCRCRWTTQVLVLTS